MKKPVIGIMPLIDTQKESYWMLPGYMDGLRQAGALPIMLPLTSDETELQQIVDMCDGFLFTGGQDVSPSLYHAPLSEQCGECCPRIYPRNIHRKRNTINPRPMTFHATE